MRCCQKNSVKDLIGDYLRADMECARSKCLTGSNLLSILIRNEPCRGCGFVSEQIELE